MKFAHLPVLCIHQNCCGHCRMCRLLYALTPPPPPPQAQLGTMTQKATRKDTRKNSKTSYSSLNLCRFVTIATRRDFDCLVCKNALFLWGVPLCVFLSVCTFVVVMMYGVCLYWATIVLSVCGAVTAALVLHLHPKIPKHLDLLPY